MATRETDGCFQRAEPGEELFTLLARDPVAPFLVRIWCILRWTIGKPDWSAWSVAHRMEEWRRRKREPNYALPIFFMIMAAVCSLIALALAIRGR